MGSTGQDIFPVFPTPMHHQLMKVKLKIAQKGHDILKRKSEVLEMRFRKVGKEIIKIKRLMGDIFKEASFLLAEARFIIGDFNQMVLSAVDKAKLKVKHRTENVAGVNLRIFESYKEGGDAHDLAGLAKGGAKLTSIKQTYTNAVEILVELATLQTTFYMLDEPIVRRDRKEGWEKFCGFKLVWAFACRLQLPSSTPVEVPEIIIHYNLSLHHSKQSLLMKGAFSRLWGFGGRENGDVQTIFTASFLYQIKEGSLAESNVRFRADYYGVIGRNGCRFSLPSSSIRF
ncbi:v-type proton ATPase subunit D 1 [Trichonephila inaurata madagascariensis]|uniref:V-type proton ATPase subunit D 1 n=1 Tax=Trichonephila inaurata madagascariensis TaxID=2747483 RepID=A0A8X7BSV7_9ARAC|nr:v-type proton ATPase subunit D 1 [Trichonephila inaurata madagascariensis]